MLSSYKTFYLLLVGLLIFSNAFAQLPLYNGVAVSDTGFSNNIGSANTSRNVSVSNDGIIYVVYAGSSGIRVSKSVNRGQSFLPSVSISPFVSISPSDAEPEPEIIVNDAGIVFVAWVESGNIMLSRSTDEGVTFSLPVSIGPGANSVHLAVFGAHIYATDKRGEFVYANSNNGMGQFITTTFTRRVFADVRTDQNGVVYVPSDDPRLFLSVSGDNTQTFSSILLSPGGSVFFSSYALSDGPCGTYIFVGGGANRGYKINVTNGLTVPINLAQNFFQGRTLYADNRGTLIDGYQNIAGDLVMNVSNDQGQTFETPIVIGQGGSHNIARNPVTDDIVVVFEQNGEILVSVYDNLLKSIKIDDTVPLETCLNETLTVPFIVSNGFNPNTELTFFLSDATGNFENKTQIGSIITNTSGSLDITLPANTIPGNLYRVQIESVLDCTQSNIANVTVFENPAATVTSNSPICQEGNAIFTFTGTPNAEVFYALNSSMSSGTVILDTVGQGTVVLNNVLEDVTMTLERVVNNTTNCSTVLTQEETVMVLPLPAINLSSDYLLCVDLNGTETATTPPTIDTFLTTTEYNFSWFKDGVEQTQFTNFSSMVPTEGGNYTVQITNRATGCSATSDIIRVNESSPPNITARVTTPAFSNNHVIEVEATNTASNNPISSYEFSLNDGNWILGDGNLGQLYRYTFSTNVRLGENTISVRDVNGCGENNIKVVVMDYPLFFTPNGDSFNDTWNITAPQFPIDYLAQARILIFDRYGKLLKQLNPLGAGWDGTYNGSIMPSDDYWFRVYFIDPLDDQPKQFHAHFTLKR